MLLPVSSLGDLERGHTSESEAGYSLLAPHIVVMSPKPETSKTQTSVSGSYVRTAKLCRISFSPSYNV